MSVKIDTDDIDWKATAETASAEAERLGDQVDWHEANTITLQALIAEHLAEIQHLRDIIEQALRGREKLFSEHGTYLSEFDVLDEAER